MGDQNQVWNIVNGNTPPPPTSATTRTTSTSTTSSHPTTTKTTGKSSTTSTKSTTSSLPTATTKRGLGFSDTDFPQDINLFHTSKIGWVYNWSPNTESYFQGLDFVPMQWNGANIANLAAEVAALHATAVLVCFYLFNISFIIRSISNISGRRLSMSPTFPLNPT
jgi:hypothetical protein